MFFAVSNIPFSENNLKKIKRVKQKFIFFSCCFANIQFKKDELRMMVLRIKLQDSTAALKIAWSSAAGPYRSDNDFQRISKLQYVPVSHTIGWLIICRFKYHHIPTLSIMYQLVSGTNRHIIMKIVSNSYIQNILQFFLFDLL